MSDIKALASFLCKFKKVGNSLLLCTDLVVQRPAREQQKLLNPLNVCIVTHLCVGCVFAMCYLVQISLHQEKRYAALKKKY